MELILTGSKVGSRSELERWIGTHRQRLIRIARSILHDHDDAEDIVQQTLAGAWQVAQTGAQKIIDQARRQLSERLRLIPERFIIPRNWLLILAIVAALVILSPWLSRMVIGPELAELPLLSAIQHSHPAALEQGTFDGRGHWLPGPREGG